MNPPSPAADEEQPIIHCPGPAAKSRRIKATWHLEIVTGKEGRALLEMQNQAIVDLLIWAAEHEKASDHNVGSDREICLQ